MSEKPQFQARNAGMCRIEGREPEPYPVHIVFIDRDHKDRRCTRFVADFNQNIPGAFALAELIARHLNESGFILPR